MAYISIYLYLALSSHTYEYISTRHRRYNYLGPPPELVRCSPQAGLSHSLFSITKYGTHHTLACCHFQIILFSELFLAFNTVCHTLQFFSLIVFGNIKVDHFLLSRFFLFKIIYLSDGDEGRRGSVALSNLATGTHEVYEKY